MESFADVILAMGCFVHACFIAGVSIVLFSLYKKGPQRRKMTHVRMVALSYFLLTMLVAGSITFKIFIGGPSRIIAICIALVAFIIGDIALTFVLFKDGVREGLRTAWDVMREQRRKRNDHNNTNMD